VSPLPLAGRRILVTRSVHQAGKLSEGLRLLGAIPMEVPVIEIDSPTNFVALDGALGKLCTYDWLILTSANTVRALKKRGAALGISLSESAAKVKVAAIGAATAAEAANAGLQITKIPESYVAESLVEALKDLAAGQKILLARAELARDLIPDALRAAGAQLDVVDAYRNRMPADAPERLRAALEHDVDAVTFTSSSCVTHLKHAAEYAGLPWPLSRVPAISVGPVTSATLCSLGWEPAAEANPSDIPGLVAAIARLLGRA
jgi:uroporphyrinogen-III synthase